MSEQEITILGGGLAGCEAAWQLCQRGLRVELLEARPAVQSPAHQGLLLGELVCSNSLRSDAEDTAPGLLKEEMRRLGSLVMSAAAHTRVPAGSALAVDREAFAWRLTATLLELPTFRLRRAPAHELPRAPALLASGPLTSPGLSRAITRVLGRGLYFYDAIAPIVELASVDMDRAFYGARRQPESRDYINCPMDRRTYADLVLALRQGQQTPPHPFEEPRFFEGCLPVEVMAARGPDVLAYGPLRPVGLTDPRTGARPHAVVQLRAEDPHGMSYNLVGFQTRLVQGEQRRVFRMIPGLERARFLRYGSIHRNTFIDAPSVLAPTLDLKALPGVKVAGQLAGVEGYLESTAMGLLAGLFMAAELRGQRLDPPPPTTAMGALLHHITRPRLTGERFEPSKINFGLMPPLERAPRKKRERRQATASRALDHLDRWMEENGSCLITPGR